MTTPPARRFSTATSVCLDALRLGSAVMIALAHLTQPYFSVGWPNLTDQGKPALVLLFLLSGLVIRYVTQLRRGRMTDFWVDRLSRVYSVAVPALLFTIVASFIAMRVNPAFYVPNWGMNHDRPWLRIFMNLTFMAQSWNLTLYPFSNQPFWTLSYEVFYYAFYAAAFFLAGPRRAFCLLLLAVLAGQHVLLLLPLWLIGCLAQDVYQRMRNAKISTALLNLRFLAVGLVAGVLLPLSVRGVLYLKGFETRFFWMHHRTPVNLHWAYIYYAEGVPMLFLLLWAMLLLDRVQLTDKAAWVRWVRLLSEATFPLYLLHFPLYVLIVSIFPNQRENAWFKAGMLLTCITVSVILAKPTVQFKNCLRDLLRKYIVHQPLVAATPQLEAAK